MNVKELIKAENEYLKKLQELKDKIINELQMIDNPNIKKITTNIFIVKKSDLNNNWDPNYHLTDKQIKYIKIVIQRAHSLAELIHSIQTLQENGFVISNEDKIKLNPLMKQKLKEIEDSLVC